MSGPLLCPRCRDAFRFSSTSELRLHLITNHSYETLLLLSQGRRRSPRPRSLLPLLGPSEAPPQSSSLGTERQERPRSLEAPDPASTSSTSTSTSTALVLSPRHIRELVLTVDLGLEERLGLGLDLGSRIVRTLEQVELRVERKLERLKSRLRDQDQLLRDQRSLEQQLRSERQQLEDRTLHLSSQVSAAEELMDKLRKDLEDRESELCQKQQEMEQIECFLRGLAQREAEAKVKLQVFIESLLDRAERAERQLLLLTSGPDQDLSRESLEELVTRRLQESSGNRRSFSLSDSEQLQQNSMWESAPTRTLSLGSPPDELPPPSLSSTRFYEGGWGRTWSKSQNRDQDED